MTLADTSNTSMRRNDNHGDNHRSKTTKRTHVSGCPPTEPFIEKSRQKQLAQKKNSSSSEEETDSVVADPSQLSIIAIPNKQSTFNLEESDLTDDPLREQQEMQFGLYQKKLVKQGFLNNDDSIKSQISAFVTNVLFPQLKFINSKEELLNLDPNTSLMSWVTDSSRMNIHPNVREQWWKQHSRKLNHSFNKRRNNCTKELKKLFLRK